MNLFLLLPEFESVLSCTAFTGVPRIYNSKGLAALTHLYYPYFRLFGSHMISSLGQTCDVAGLTHQHDRHASYPFSNVPSLYVGILVSM